MSKANEQSRPEEPVSSPAKSSTVSGGTGTSKDPVFFKVPIGWKDMSEEEKDRFLDEAASAIMKVSQPWTKVAPQDRPKLEGETAPQQPEKNAPS